MHWQVRLSVKTKFFVFTYILHGLNSDLLEIRKAPNIKRSSASTTTPSINLHSCATYLPIYLVNHTSKSAFKKSDPV